MQYPTIDLPTTHDHTDNVEMANCTSTDIKQTIISSNLFSFSDQQTKCNLPQKSVNLRKPCLDLLNRLLEIKPQQRLRSLIGLEKIAIYKGYSFEDVRKKRVCKKKQMISDS